MKQMNLQIWRVFAAFAGTLLLSSCAALQDVTQIQAPRVSFQDVRYTGLSFDAIDLAVDVNIHNYNPVSINFSGFDYEFDINDNPFLTGQQEYAFSIAAMDQTTVQIPVSVNYQDVYNTVSSLLTEDQASYRMAGGVLFDVPVLGQLRIPFSKRGEFPAVKLPDIQVSGLRVTRLDVGGADIALNLEIANPNAFELLLNRIDYTLLINGRNLMQGIGEPQTRIAKNSSAPLSLGMSLDFAQVGLTLYQILSGQNQVNYELQGSLDVGSSLPLLKHATIPLNRSGVLNISR